jgi:hypothetical protein
MAQIICLANSFKGGGRCIAGIDIDTGEWVRPFNPRGDEGALGRERLIKGDEPRILDVLDIPIGEEAEDYGCQPENRILLSGRWKKIGTILPEDALKYVEEDILLLHNDAKKVESAFFESLPKEQWKSLQLIQVRDVRFHKNLRNKWRCDFNYYRCHYELPFTDPKVIDRLDSGGGIAKRCLLIISLGGPFDKDNGGTLYWYKIVAGVVEL